MSAEELRTLAGFAVAFVAFVGINLGAMQWLLQRHIETQRRDAGAVATLQRELLELKAELPLEYVRREDWIRFGATIDAKLDPMRDETREELGRIRKSFDQLPCKGGVCNEP